MLKYDILKVENKIQIIIIILMMIVIINITIIISNSSTSCCSVSSFCLFSKFLWTVHGALTTIGITVTFMFNNLSRSLARFRRLSSFSSFSFCDLLICLYLKIFYAFNSQAQILLCICTIYEYGQFSVICTIPYGTAFANINVCS